jgi:hypothetical protein
MGMNEVTISCPFCNAEIPETVKFCAFCGKDVSVDEAAQKDVQAALDAMRRGGIEGPDPELEALKAELAELKTRINKPSRKNIAGFGLDAGADSRRNSIWG